MLITLQLNLVTATLKRLKLFRLFMKYVFFKHNQGTPWIRISSNWFSAWVSLRLPNNQSTHSIPQDKQTPKIRCFLLSTGLFPSHSHLILNTHCHTWSTSPFLLNPQYTRSLTTKWGEEKTSRHEDDLFYRALVTGGWMLLLFLSSSVSLHVCSTPVYLSGWNHVITASELFKQMRHLRSSPFSSTPALARIHQKAQFQVPA